MDCHDHTQHVQGRALKVALGIACVFMLVEVIGGLAANSLALMSDALHLFTDVGALLLSLVVIRIARRPRTRSMSYGYHRAEILGALASALSLWALCGVLIYQAIERLITPENVQGPIVFVIATIGLIANFWMMRVLHPTQGESLNVRAAYLHVLGDLLGSVGVILSGLILWATHWNPIDPIITLLFSCAILYSSGKIIKRTVGVLMESAPEGVDTLAIERDLAAIPGVKQVHSLHVWSVSSHRLALSVHLAAENTAQALEDAHRLIENNHHIHHMTIQVEDPASFQSRFCYDCEKNSNDLK
jgi:cobalt-zinc-cadmium efflux system protein